MRCFVARWLYCRIGWRQERAQIYPRRSTWTTLASVFEEQKNQGRSSRAQLRRGTPMCDVEMHTSEVRNPRIGAGKHPKFGRVHHQPRLFLLFVNDVLASQPTHNQARQTPHSSRTALSGTRRSECHTAFPSIIFQQTKLSFMGHGTKLFSWTLRSFVVVTTLRAPKLLSCLD